MARIFVSSERVDDAPVARLIDALRRAGADVDHSPRNPADGPDPRWEAWYERGCLDALGAADVFVAGITAGWDSSTWMAIEGGHAMTWRDRGQIKRVCHFNPHRYKVRPGNIMWELYSGEALPGRLDRAVAALLRPAQPATGGA